MPPSEYPAFTHCLLQNEVPFQLTIETLSHAHSSGATTIFNPSPLPSSQELCEFPWKAVDWLIVNEGEARSLAVALHNAQSQTTGPSEMDEDTEATKDPRIGTLSTLHYLPSFATSVNIVCTLGSQGVIALLMTGDTLYVPAAKLNGPVRDTTGAGDCFTGYFVAGLMASPSESMSNVESILQGAVNVSNVPFVRI